MLYVGRTTNFLILPIIVVSIDTNFISDSDTFETVA